MSKFEIGSQWKTSGGWRAIVVSKVPIGFVAYHEKHTCSYNRTYAHLSDGKRNDLGPLSEYDLIEPWAEPVVHEGWVNVSINSHGNCVFSALFKKGRESLDNVRTEGCIACIKVKFTEGEGL